ncbi:MAG: S8 family serine peptidase [Elusimicrobiota bacterium]
MKEKIKRVLVAVIIAGTWATIAAARDFEFAFKQGDAQVVKLLRMAGIVYKDDWKMLCEEDKKILLLAINNEGRLTPLGQKMLEELISARLANPNTQPKEKVQRVLSMDLARRSWMMDKYFRKGDPGPSNLWRLSQNMFAGATAANQLVSSDMFDWIKGSEQRSGLSLSIPSGADTVRLLVSPRATIAASRYNIHKVDGYEAAASSVLTQAGIPDSVLAKHQAKLIHALKIFNLLVIEVPKSEAQNLGLSLETSGHHAKPASQFRMTLSRVPARPNHHWLRRAPPADGWAPASLGAGQGWSMFSRTGAPAASNREFLKTRSQTFEPELVDSVPMIKPNKFYQAGIHGENAIALVVDSGLDLNHQDFAGRQVIAKDFTDDEDNKDYVGHGTHVTSTALGSGEASNSQYRGVAYGTQKILVAKIFGKSPNASEDSILAGLDWGVTQANGKKIVVNMSLGGPGNQNDLMSRAVNLLAHQGHAVIVAAGNSGPDKDTVKSPGVARDVLTVAASDKSGRITEYSSRGNPDGYDTPALSGASYAKPDLTAPGGDVNYDAAERLRRLLNPLWEPLDPSGRNQKKEHCLYASGIIAAKSSSMGESSCDVIVNGRRLYTKMSGTSMATPHVMGANLLVLDYLERRNAVTDNSFLESKAAQMEAAQALAHKGKRYKSIEQGKGLLQLDRLYDLVSARLEVGLPIGNISAEIASWVSSNKKLTQTIEKYSSYKVTRYGIVDQKSGDIINTDAELDLLVRASRERKKKGQNWVDKAKEWLHL